MRWDDFNDVPLSTFNYVDDTGTVVAHPRSGQLVMEYLNTVLRPSSNCLSFNQHRGTKLPCGPTRAEIMTGLIFPNHGVQTDEITGTAANYTATYVDGTIVGGNYIGPWNKDLAAAYPVTPVLASAQTTRGAGDDLQAFTGCMFCFLARYIENVAIFGKYQNGFYSTTASAANSIPAGVTAASIMEAYAAPHPPSHWASIAHEYTGPNAWDGPGATPTTVTYSCSHTISRCEYAAGESIITGAVHQLQVGDEVAISGVSDASYNGIFVVSALDATTPTTKFRYKNPAAGATITTGLSAARSFNRNYYESNIIASKCIEFTDGLADNDPFFVYLAPRWPHLGLDGTYNDTAEKRYLGKVSQSDAFYWDNVAGATSPVGPSTGYKPAFAARHEMLASVDDMIRTICENWTARWGDDWFLIITGDNGDQIGEQDIRGNGQSKATVWEGSLRNACLVISPKFAEVAAQFGYTTDVDDVPTMHPDILATVLDMYDATDHHVHTKREGRSWFRLLDPTDPYRARCTPIFGMTFGAAPGNGYVDEFGVKRLRGTTNRYYLPNFGADYNGTPGDYELVAYAYGAGPMPTPDLATFTARANAIQACRCDVTTGVNPAGTI